MCQLYCGPWVLLPAKVFHQLALAYLCYALHLGTQHSDSIYKTVIYRKFKTFLILHVIFTRCIYCMSEFVVTHIAFSAMKHTFDHTLQRHINLI